MLLVLTSLTGIFCISALAAFIANFLLGMKFDRWSAGGFAVAGIVALSFFVALVAILFDPEARQSSTSVVGLYLFPMISMAGAICGMVVSLVLQIAWDKIKSS